LKEGDRCRTQHVRLHPSATGLILDLLGLVVHLDRVSLDITAESAPGNLLAICCVRWPICLMDRPVDWAGSLPLLNRILALLG